MLVQSEVLVMFTLTSYTEAVLAVPFFPCCCVLQQYSFISQTCPTLTDTAESAPHCTRFWC